MGYVQCYGLRKEIKEIPSEAFTKIQEVMEEYKEILRFECDEDKEPLVTKTKIRFNGYGEFGYETFYFSVKEFDHFCKTNTKDYDMPVCIILLLLFHYIPEFKLSSDGFWISKGTADEFRKTGKVELDGYWNEALTYVKEKYNISFEWHLEVSRSSGYEYYCMNICRTKETIDSDKIKKPEATKEITEKSRAENKVSSELIEKELNEKETTKIEEAKNKEKKNEKQINTQTKKIQKEETKTKDKSKAKKNKTEKSKLDKTKFSKEEKSEYFKNQLQELKDSIEDKILNFLENSQELKNFIKFKNDHFRTYSFRNSMLIYNQFPTASYVAGFNKWKELGYSVVKGSKAIKILVPLIKKNENSKNEDSKEIYGFRAVNVFDVSQVQAGPDATPLPSIDLDIQSTEHMEYSEETLFNACKIFVESKCPLHIVKEDTLHDCLGLTNGKEIFLLDTKKPLDMAAVLVHEYSHFHNHYKENRKTLTKDEKETEAEITAIIFASYFNLNHENRFKYLAMYRKNRELDKCFTTALNTFDYLLLGEDGKSGLKSILESLEKEKNYEPKAS